MNSKWFVGVCLPLLVVAGCGVDTTEKQDGGNDKVSWSNQNMVTANCTNDAQCTPYQKCVVGGTVGCLNGGCAGFHNDSVDFNCVKNTTEQSGTCGQVTAPPECLSHDAADANCNFFEGMRPNEDQYRAWLQVTADQPNSTVTVHSLSGYCVHYDGTLTPTGGTAKGEQAVSWAGHYRRDTWYNPSDQVAAVTLNGNNTYTVPTNPLLLHLGNGGSSVGCREIVLQAIVSTTGDAKVELGLDYYVGNVYGHESCVSGWKSCVTGNVTLMTPRSDKLTCEGDLGSVGNPTPTKNPCDGVADGTTQAFGGGSLLGECRAGKRLCSNGTWIVLEQPFNGSAETCDGKDNDCDGAVDNGNVCGPLNNCPATGMKVSPGQALLGPCPGLITKTWGMGGTQYTSAPGQPLIITDNWSGYAYIETVCNGQEGIWPPGVTNAQAGFAEICTQGQNVTTSTFVCWDQYSYKYRPTVPLSPSGAGSCP